MRKVNPYSYEETSLQQRMEAHKQYAKYDINDWIFSLLHLQETMHILDIGCGIGKQTIAYASKVTAGYIVGIDISFGLLQEARTQAEAAKTRITFIQHDANVPFYFIGNNSFDLISCCFTIYYLQHIQRFLLEVRRMLKDTGRIFIVAPTMDNAKEMIILHSNITGKQALQSRERRIYDTIIPVITKTFQQIETHIFENPLHFSNTQSFLDYYISTLLFNESTNDLSLRTSYLGEMRQRVEGIIAREGYFKLTKQVYGILGRKERE